VNHGCDRPTTRRNHAEPLPCLESLTAEAIAVKGSGDEAPVALDTTRVRIAITAFRRCSRWAWWTLLAGYTIALGAPIVYDQATGAIGVFEVGEWVVTRPFLEAFAQAYVLALAASPDTQTVLAFAA
jgi:hypothetical protein